MEKIGNLLNSKNHNLSYEFDITASANADVGHLNELDGIDCPICKNKGYILVDDDNEVTQTFIPCKCMNKRKVKRLSEESGLGELLNYRVKNYKTESEWQKNVKRMAIKYVKENSNMWFCMLGQSGSGKTHICSAICNAFIEDFKDVRYVVWNDFAKYYKDNLKNSSSKNILEEYQNVDILYIDDLFKGSDSDFDVRNIAYDLINYRYNNRLKTIISSELSFKKLCELDEAIAYRIAEMCQQYMIKIPKTLENNYRNKKLSK